MRSIQSIVHVHLLMAMEQPKPARIAEDCSELWPYLEDPTPLCDSSLHSMAAVAQRGAGPRTTCTKSPGRIHLANAART